MKIVKSENIYIVIKKIVQPVDQYCNNECARPLSEYCDSNCTELNPIIVLTTRTDCLKLKSDFCDPKKCEEPKSKCVQTKTMILIVAN